MLRSIRGLKLFSSRSLRGVKPNGFTLIELLVVISILGITFALAMFAIGNRLPNWRLKESANEVVQRMQFARSAAVKNHGTVLLLFNNKNDTATSEIAIWLDDGDGVSGGAGDTLLQTVVFPTKHTGAYITTAVDGGGTAVSQIAINGRGIVTGGTMPILVTVTSTFTTTPTTYVVNISRSGVARVL